MGRGLCKICEKFFIKKRYDQDICDECYERDRKEYEIVKEYILKNKGASIMNIYLDTKVPIRTIERFIKDERIKLGDR